MAESRPGLEGRAHGRARSPTPASPRWLVVDAALPLLLSQARALWLGADAVTEFGVLNKIGSYAAALAAREHGVPVYAIATRRKFLPAATAARWRSPSMPPAEVWDAPPDGRAAAQRLLRDGAACRCCTASWWRTTCSGPTEAEIVARDRALPDELAAAAG